MVELYSDTPVKRVVIPWHTRVIGWFTGLPHSYPHSLREWVRPSLDEAKELIATFPLAMHSPFYTMPCSTTCKICNMSPALYRKAASE